MHVYSFLGGYIGLFVGYTVSQTPLMVMKCVTHTRTAFIFLFAIISTLIEKLLLKRKRHQGSKETEKT